MRPCRSPAARRRCDEDEISDERRSRGRGSGDHLTAVTNDDDDCDGGGGIGTVATSCIDRESTTATELPAPNARRPEELRSEAPKLFRLGGPGSIRSHKSGKSGGGGGGPTGDAGGDGLLRFDIDF